MAISYNTAPKENRSVRASSSLPLACSGDMYATVPTVLPGCVSITSLNRELPIVVLFPIATEAGLADLARPKSRILTCIRSVTKM